jgi:hypothetical protein
MLPIVSSFIASFQTWQFSIFTILTLSSSSLPKIYMPHYFISNKWMCVLSLGCQISVTLLIVCSVQFGGNTYSTVTS